MLSDPNNTVKSGSANGAGDDAAALASDGRQVIGVAAGGTDNVGASNEAAVEPDAGVAAGAASTSSVVGDDGATDAGMSSLPPSEIGGHGALESVGAVGSLIGGMVGPPSPLTGCYLLIILGEPHSEEHKNNILQHLLKGFLSWDVADCHVDLEEELRIVAQHAPEGEEARYGERLIQYASENLVTEVLIHPQYNTLIQCMRNLLSSFTRHRHIIHAGYTFSGNGSWILQDGTFSVSDFSEALQEHDVQRVMRAYTDTITMNIHCADAGLWHTLSNKPFARSCKLRINPVDVLETSSEGINAFLEYLSPMLVPTSLGELLETSDVVGNIRFTHPTLYVFPGGQGDSALFGINGFNMLVDGGFNRKSCFWDFARHLDRLDAVLMTRLNNSNIQGLESVITRKREEHVYPQIGHFFCNIPERKSGLPSPDGDKDRNPLLVDLFERGHNLINDVKSLDLKPHNCYRNQEPINLYHKVGHGTLDMYVISPSRDSKEVKEFLQKWSAGDQRLFTARDSKEFNFPLHNMVSICALLVWQPANPEDSITRILFPGSTPDFKIQEGLEKIKHLDFMKYSTCTAKSIAPAIQTSRKTFKSTMGLGTIEAVLTTKPSKFSSSATPAISTQHQDNKTKEFASHADNLQEHIEKVGVKTLEKDESFDNDEKATETGDEAVLEHTDEAEKAGDDKIDGEKVTMDRGGETEKDGEDKKIEIMIVKPQPQTGKDVEDNVEGQKKSYKSKSDKPRAEVKPVIRSRIDTKPPKSMDRKIIKKDLITDKKSSPSASPKKQPAIIRDTKPKVASRITKTSPGSTPAKSTKDANNRKVLESKQQSTRQSVTSTRREAVRTAPPTTTDKKDKNQQAQQRKPISRRPRGTSPSKRPPGSPVKAVRPKVDLKKTRLDKGGTTDSSLVSTPSLDEATGAKKIQDLASQELDAEKQRELDDLKEEQEVVREIEAVFSRDELKRQQHFKTEIREISKQDSTTEAEDDEEYLIIEREEIEQYTEDSNIEPDNILTKEDEIQKHQRDSQESEKKRKSSADDLEEEVKNDVQKTTGMAAEAKTDIKAEVQEIITTAKEIAKARSEDQIAKPEEELSSPTPEDKLSSAKKTSDTKDDLVDLQEVIPVNLQESLPEEKFSTTFESGATTAPTLPEDERIPLDEIKEDIIIEEKHVKEVTKETEVPFEDKSHEKEASEKAEKTSAERVLPMKMTFDIQQNLHRDAIKTPDEVADLPVDEEADLDLYQKDSHDRTKHAQKESDRIDKKIKEVSPDKEISNDVKTSAVKEKIDQPITTTKIEVTLDDEKSKPQETAAEDKHEQQEPKTSMDKPNVKDISDMESEDVLPAQGLTNVSSNIKVKEHEDTVSMESPATIEEAIEVEMHYSDKHTLAKRSIQQSEDVGVVQTQYEIREIETVSSPIDKGSTSLVGKDFTISQLDYDASKLPTVSSPVDVAMGDFTKHESIEAQDTMEPAFDRATTVSSPIDEAMKATDDHLYITEVQETNIMRTGSPEFKITISELGEPILHDIKEEDEEHYVPPHAADRRDIRPVSPREEEVIKIVAGVAEVLKSEKDITEIIPDFDETELEMQIKNLQEGKSADLADISSTIKKETMKPLELIGPGLELLETKQELDSEKSSPDQKSAPISIEEKDKIEESEKTLLKESLSKKNVPDIEIRRESTVSVVSEKDLTKEESTSDEKSATVLAQKRNEPKDEIKTEFVTQSSHGPQYQQTAMDERAVSPPSHGPQYQQVVMDERAVSPPSHGPQYQQTAMDERAVSPPSHGPQYQQTAMDERAVSPPSHGPQYQQTAMDERAVSPPSHGPQYQQTAMDERAVSPPSHGPQYQQVVMDERAVSPPSHGPQYQQTAMDERAVSPPSHGPQYQQVVMDERAVSPPSHGPQYQQTAMDERAVSPPSHGPQYQQTAMDERAVSPPSHGPQYQQVVMDERAVSPPSHGPQYQQTAMDKRVVSPPSHEPQAESDEEQVSEEEKDYSSSKESVMITSESENKLTSAPTAKSVSSQVRVQQETEKEATSRKASVMPTAEAKNEELTAPQPKETSRPESVASHVSLTQEIEDVSRRESSVSDVKVKADEKSSPPSKDGSRPESAASHQSIQPETEKEDTSRRESVMSTAAAKKEDLTTPQPKETSRPESVASHVSLTQEIEDVSRRESSVSDVKVKADEKSSPPSKDGSRPESAASHQSIQPETEKEATSRKASVMPTAEAKNEELTAPQPKETSRQESVASHVSLTQEIEDVSRRESSVSDSKLKADEKSSSPSKDGSRPESAASHQSIQPETEKEDTSRRESVMSTAEAKKEELTTPQPKETSRPESVASHVSLTQEIEDVSRRESSVPDSKLKADEKSSPPSKDGSRPESAASHQSIQPETEKEDTSRRESVMSTAEAKKEDLSTPQPTETSRPESVASHVSLTQEIEDVSRRESSVSDVKVIADEKSSPPSKDGSRPESAASHQSIQPETEKEDTSRRESVMSTAEAKKEDLTSPQPKETSRPESVASHVSLTQEIEDISRRESSVSDVKVKADEKSSPPSKDGSRPESAASHQSIQPETEKEDTSRRESVMSTAEAKKEDLSTPQPTETSRPESVASHVILTQEIEDVSRRESSVSDVKVKADEKSSPPSKDGSRPESAASHQSIQPETEKEDTSRRESVMSTAEAKKEDLSTPQPTETSRPESVASHVSLTQEIEDVSRRESSVSDVKVIADEKSSPPSKDGSRPESAASHQSIQPETEKEDTSRRESVMSTAEAKKEDLTSPQPKETSRPESVASHVSLTQEIEDISRRESSVSDVKVKADEKSSPPSKDGSRPESAASHQSIQPETEKEDTSRRESVMSTAEAKKEDLSTPQPTETSRPESVASHVILTQEIEDVSRRESSVSDVKVKADEKSSPPSKDGSRPESAASHQSIQPETEKEDTSRRESVMSTAEAKKEDLSTPQPTETSRPESVASHVSLTQEIEDVSRRESSVSDVKVIADEKSSPPSKDGSRPESAASHQSIQPETEKEDTSRRESVMSTAEAKKEDLTSPQPKETSRPESVASHVSLTQEIEDVSRRESSVSDVKVKADEKSTPPSKDGSRPESAASHQSIQPETEKEDTSRRESVMSTAEAKKEDLTTPQPKETSRPGSVASHVSLTQEIEDVSRRESSVSDSKLKADEKSSPPSKDGSRPESAASHQSIQPETEKEDTSRRESVMSTAEAKKEELTAPQPIETSRPESVASHVSLTQEIEDISRRESSVSDVKVIADEKSSPPSKDGSRPESAASHQSIQPETEKEDTSRRESVMSTAEAKKEELTAPQPKETSRPESVASHVSLTQEIEDVSRKESSVSDSKLKADEKSTPPSKDGSRPESAASHQSIQPETEKEDTSRRESVMSTAEAKKEDLTSPQPKETSRPESVASHVSLTQEIEDISRRESSVSDVKVIADEKSSPPSKDGSRPESAASHQSIQPETEKEDTSRRESVMSTAEAKKEELTAPQPKETSRPESVASHVSLTQEIEDVSRKESSVSDSKLKADEKSTPPSKDGSRPESAASHQSIQPETEKEDTSRRESVMSTAEAKKEDLTTPQPTETSRPESVASHVSLTQEIEDVSRRESSVSDSKLKADEKSTPPSKDGSRPESAASHESIQPETEKEDTSRRESVMSTAEAKKEDLTTPQPKETSRPESVASHVSLTQEIEDVSRRESSVSDVKVKADDKSSPPSKDGSRPESVASHQSIQPETEKEDTSRRESVMSTAEAKKEDLTTPQPKETSRPESVASHVSEQHEQEDASRRESSISAAGIRPEHLISLSKDCPRPSNLQADKEEETIGQLVSTMLLTDKEIKQKSNESCVKIKSSALDLPLSSTKSKSHDSPTPISIEESLVQKQHFYLTTEDKLDDSAQTSSKTPPRTESMSSSQVSPKRESSPTTKYISVQDEIEAALKQEKNQDMEKFTNEGILKMSSLSDDGDVTEPKEILKETVAEFIATEKIISFKESTSMETTLKSDPLEKTGTISTTKIVSTHDKAGSGLTETHSDQEDGAEDFDFLNVKEGRSKSIASVMMTSIYKPFEQMTGISTLPDQILEEVASQTQNQQVLLDSNRKISIPSNEKSHVEYSIYSSDIERTDRKTPPTAPVSPGIKSSATGVSTIMAAPSTIAGGSCTTSVTGPLSPKDVSGKSSPGVLTSESQSIPTPFGRESQTETPESSPKPTSPFPRVSKEELKGSSERISATETSSGAVESESSSEVISDLHGVRGIEKATALSSSTEKIITTTITTVTKVTSADGKETVTQEKTVTTTDTSEPDGEKVTVTTTRTTSESDKSDLMLPKEVSVLRGNYRSSTPGSDDERGIPSYMSDEELPGSPRSIASSHVTSYDLQRSSSGVSKRSDFDVEDNQDDIPPQYGSDEHSSARSLLVSQSNIDPMSTSYYGTLPESFDIHPSRPIPIQGISSVHFATHQTEAHSLSSVSSDSTSQVAPKMKDPSTDHKFLEEADQDFEKALKEHVELRGENVMSSVTAKYSYSPSKAEELQQAVVEKEKSKFPLSDIQKLKVTESASPSSPEVSTTVSSDSSATAAATSSSDNISASGSQETTGALRRDPLKEWGKPLGLPIPAPIFEGDIRTTPKKERRLMTTKTRLNNEKNLRKRSESPNKLRKQSPVYVDLTYVPHNGNSYYSHLDFFKRVRARYYVFSGTEPSREVYDALLEAKQTWEDKDLEVTIIPTYDTDVLGYWVAENEDLLAKNRIDLSPSASRCTINLQDHETSCSAYRLEF